MKFDDKTIQLKKVGTIVKCVIHSDSDVLTFDSCMHDYNNCCGNHAYRVGKNVDNDGAINIFVAVTSMNDHMSRAYHVSSFLDIMQKAGVECYVIKDNGTATYNMTERVRSVENGIIRIKRDIEPDDVFNRIVSSIIGGEDAKFIDYVHIPFERIKIGYIINLDEMTKKVDNPSIVTADCRQRFMFTMNSRAMSDIFDRTWMFIAKDDIAFDHSVNVIKDTTSYENKKFKREVIVEVTDGYDIVNEAICFIPHGITYRRLQ